MYSVLKSEREQRLCWVHSRHVSAAFDLRQPNSTLTEWRNGFVSFFLMNSGGATRCVWVHDQTGASACWKAAGGHAGVGQTTCSPTCMARCADLPFLFPSASSFRRYLAHTVADCRFGVFMLTGTLQSAFYHTDMFSAPLSRGNHCEVDTSYGSNTASMWKSLHNIPLLAF